MDARATDSVFMTQTKPTLHQLMVVALSVMLWPGAAEALTMWGPEQGSCYDTTVDAAAVEIAQSTGNEVVASLAVADAEPGCADADPDDSSFNICFEDAEGPVSTFPQLIAELRAEKIARDLTDNALALTEVLRPADSEATSNVFAEPRKPVILPLEEPEPECSSYPVQCRSMPPLPALLVVDASSLSVPIPRVEFDYPDVIDLPESQNATPFEGLGPAAGFASPLEEPPQVA